MLRRLSAAAWLAVLSAPAFAHFQEITPSADVLPEGGPVTLEMVFTHPVEGGPTMDMKKPVRAGVLFGGEVTDLLPDLAETPVGGAGAWTVTHWFSSARACAPMRTRWKPESASVTDGMRMTSAPASACARAISGNSLS